MAELEKKDAACNRKKHAANIPGQNKVDVFKRRRGWWAEDTTSVERSRERRGKAVEGAPFEGGAPVQCKEDVDGRGVASRTSPCSIII